MVAAFHDGVGSLAVGAVLWVKGHCGPRAKGKHRDNGYAQAGEKLRIRMAIHLFNAELMVRAVAMGDGRQYLTFVHEACRRTRGMFNTG